MNRPTARLTCSTLRALCTIGVALPLTLMCADNAFARKAAPETTHASDTETLSPADAAAFRQFKLTDDFYGKWKKMQKGVLRDPCHLDAFIHMDDEDDAGKKSQVHSLADLTARYEAQPGAKALLAESGLTTREYFLGAMALYSAGIQQMAQEHPEMVEKGYVRLDPALKASPENMAFYRAHKADLDAFNLQLGTEAFKRNGGKLPDCGR